MLDKRTKPSLSIVNPLDVLRQRLLLEIARRQMRENSKQVNSYLDFFSLSLCIVEINSKKKLKTFFYVEKGNILHTFLFCFH